jgi:DNA-binding MarR family transcriptional regulator
MTRACDQARTANLLGALALAGAERIETATDAAAVVALVTTLGGTSQDVLGRVLGLTQTGAVRLVDRLVRQGLVERRDGPDGRTKAIVPTDAGRRRASAVLEERGAVTHDLLAPLDAAERAQLTSLLEKLLGGITHSRDDALHICRLCDPDACGHHEGRCPVTNARIAAEG